MNPTPESEMMADAIAKMVTSRLEHLHSEIRKRPYGVVLSPTVAAIGATVKEIVARYLDAAYAKRRAEALEQAIPDDDLRRFIISLLVDCASLIQPWMEDLKREGGWTEWDQSVRDRITDALRRLQHAPQSPPRSGPA